MTARTPVLVTMRVCAGLPSLRTREVWYALQGPFGQGAERFGFRLVHLSVQTNHLHLVVEARDRVVLARGMQGLSVRIARALNRLWRRRGRLFADRYHARALKTPTEVRNALVYVLQNARKHGWRGDVLDPLSSAAAFDGWTDCAERAAGTRSGLAGPAATRRPLPRAPVVPARSWLLRTGWRRCGRIRPAETPRCPS